MTRKSAQRRREKRITPEEAIRAIYIDFEGFADESPAILGILCRYTFRQVVLDPRLERAASAKDLEMTSLNAVVEELLTKCRAEDRPLVPYTQYEKLVIRQHADVDVSPVYRDARKIARRWINAFHPDADLGERSLLNHLDFIGFERPTHLGSGVQTGRLRDVIAGLEARGSHQRLTAVQKGKWTKILNHNRIDCCGMRDLVLRAASELRDQ